MTFQRGSHEPVNPTGGSAAGPPLDLVRLAADLEPRAARLDRFVQGLASVLQRFQERAAGEDPASIFADFEAPDASHESLRVLNEASTSARHDLAVLRSDVRILVRANPSDVEPPIVGKIRDIGLAASALATRFESFARSAREWLATPGAAAHVPSPAAVDGLRAFTTIADRALRDVAEGAFVIQREDGHDEFGALPGGAIAAAPGATAAAATGATAAPTGAIAATTGATAAVSAATASAPGAASTTGATASAPGAASTTGATASAPGAASTTGAASDFGAATAVRRRLPSVRQGAVLAAAAAGGSWKGLSLAALRESRALIPLGASGAVAAVVLVAVIAANSLPPGPTADPSGVASAAASPSASDGGVAVGSASPATSPGASPGDTPGPSLEPGQTPPPTPRPGSSPAPSTPGSTPRPSSAPTPIPPGATPTPPGATPRPTPAPTPVPTPTPTLEPGAAADQFGARVTAGANAADALLDQITAHVQAVDFAAAKATAQDLETLAATERAWLQAHPPAACYQTHHTNALARYADLIAAAVEIQADADAQNANAIHNEVASGIADVAALKQAASKAMAACP